MTCPNCRIQTAVLIDHFDGGRQRQLCARCYQRVTLVRLPERRQPQYVAPEQFR